MEKTRVLVVEDEILVARDIQSKLERSGYDVPEIADTGEIAIEKAAETHPDLILMDIRIKGDIDGVEAAERICKSRRIPVVYLTAYADDATVERAKLTTPFGYILKPFQLKELKTTIEIALYRHKMESALHDAHEKLALKVAELDARDRLVHFQMSGPTLSQGWNQVLVVFDAMLQALRSAIYWPDADTAKSLEPVADLSGDAEAPVDEGGVPVDGDSLLAEVFRGGQPRSDAGTHQVAIPIVYRDIVMGVVSIHCKPENAPATEELLTSLWRVAGQAALLLRMARVGEDLSNGTVGVNELIELASGELDVQEED